MPHFGFGFRGHLPNFTPIAFGAGRRPLPDYMPRTECNRAELKDRVHSKKKRIQKEYLSLKIIISKSQKVET